ncbi:MAG TPA: N-acetyltransferase [Candidatus Deferrimicrobium sp.]|nr:N-acetyltransferase [Candidatus Deferrimicrobium sp.]
MTLIIRYPKLEELDQAISVLYSAFVKEFTYLFGKDFEFGRKLLVNFYKRTIKAKDLSNFLVVEKDKKIVAAISLDFEDPKLINFFFYFLRMNLHFFRSYTKLGIKKAFKITSGMYWFLFEDFNTDSCYINLLGVHPDYQNREIGTQILQFVEKIAKYKRLGSMTLDVSYEDLPARHLYKKLGFIETRRFQNTFLKYLNGIEGVFSMEKKLSS